MVMPNKTIPENVPCVSCAAQRYIGLAQDIAHTYGIDPAFTLTLITYKTLGDPYFKEYLQYYWIVFVRKYNKLCKFMFENNLKPSDVSSAYGLFYLNFTMLFAYGFRGMPRDLYNIETAIPQYALYVNKLCARTHSNIYLMFVNYGQIEIHTSCKGARPIYVSRFINGDNMLLIYRQWCIYLKATERWVECEIPRIKTRTYVD